MTTSSKIGKPSKNKHHYSHSHIRHSDGGDTDNSDDVPAAVVGVDENGECGDELADANNNPFLANSPMKKSFNYQHKSSTNRRRGSAAQSSMHNNNRSDHDDDDDEEDVDGDGENELDTSSSPSGQRFRSNSAALSSTSISQEQRMRESQNKSPVSTLSSDVAAHKSNEFGKRVFFCYLFKPLWKIWTKFSHL